jgi:hypothetical protein
MAEGIQAISHLLAYITLAANTDLEAAKIRMIDGNIRA